MKVIQVGSGGMGNILDRGGYRQFENDNVTLVKPVEMERVARDYLLHEFYEVVTQAKTPATSCQDNIKSLSMVFDVVKSCKMDQPIRSGERSV